jgi:hypothetical protein
MAHGDSSYHRAEFEKWLVRHFRPTEHDEVRKLLAPHLVDCNRIAQYILRLADGDLAKIPHLLDVAREDFRNIIFWVENPEQSQLNTVEECDKFQLVLEQLGLERIPSIDRIRDDLKRRSQGDNESRPSGKRWWQFWK